MGFWRGVFSDNGVGSSSRVLMGLFGITVCIAYLVVALHNHALPPAADTIAAGVFASTPYALNQAKAAVASFSGATSKPEEGKLP